MANASEQFRQSDVTRWGLVALICGGLAVLSANVSALLPQSALSMLHSTRIEGMSIEQLRVAVRNLEDEAAQMRRTNDQLATRVSRHEQDSNAVTRRVGALEISLPRLMEADAIGIDRSLPTASIAEEPTEIFAAEGGSVAVRHIPLQPPPAAEQPLPAPVETASIGDAAPAQAKFGIAIGQRIAFAEAGAVWSDLQDKLGPLLLGLEPLVAEESEDGRRRIIAGPIAELAQARTLCERLERVSIPCEPMPYTGAALPPTGAER